jgi:hypothetical protein
MPGFEEENEPLPNGTIAVWREGTAIAIAFNPK